MNYDISNLPIDMILNLLGIAIIAVLVRLLAYKPVKKFLDARRDRIEGEKTSAVDTKAEAEEMKAQYEALLSDAENKATAQAEVIISRANAEAEAIISEAKERAERVVSLAEEKILKERTAALGNIEKESISISLEIAEKILERRVTDSDTINMAQKLFKEITSADTAE